MQVAADDYSWVWTMLYILGGIATVIILWSLAGYPKWRVWAAHQAGLADLAAAVIAAFRARAEAAIEQRGADMTRLMVNNSGEIHEECPDCRGECCSEVVCQNPLHYCTDGSFEPHKIGPSCMAGQAERGQ